MSTYVLIHNNKNDWFGDNISFLSFAPLSLLNKKDTLHLWGNKCLFYLARSTIHQKQKWGSYVRIYRWKSILWSI